MKILFLMITLISTSLFAQKEKYANAGAITFGASYTTSSNVEVKVIDNGGIVYSGPVVDMSKIDTSKLPVVTVDICKGKFDSVLKQVSEKSGKDFEFLNNACKKAFGDKFVGISRVAQQKCMPVNKSNPKEWLFVPALYCFVK